MRLSLRNVLFAVYLIAASAPAAAQTLDIYFIDVEGGQATLLVSPSGQSLLVDTGWPEFGGRDADRISATVKRAGLSAVDYLVLTHYHDDHVGGLEQFADRVPFRHLITHGPNMEVGRMADIVNPIYARVMDRYKPPVTVAAPGDVIPIAGIRVNVVASNRLLISTPVPGAGAPNPKCAGTVKRREDRSDNSASVGLHITFGAFRFLDLGDLTQDLEFEMACPVNRLGKIDLYLTTHHGAPASGAEVLVHALEPRVAIMNNGARKGGDPVHIRTVRTAPGLEDLWMLHVAVAAGAENVSEPYIANIDESTDPAVNDKGYGIKVSAKADGAFTVTNERTGVTKAYPAR